MERYYAPQRRNRDVRFIGRQFHMTMVGRGRMLLVHVNADFWKSELHQRLAVEANTAGAIVLYDAADTQAHHDFAEQLTAERQVEKWLEGCGETIVWERIRRKNHFLDAGYSATAAGELILTLPSKSTRQPTEAQLAEIASRPTAAELAKQSLSRNR
jgi:Phage terminase large subunit (GpA)